MIWSAAGPRGAGAAGRTESAAVARSPVVIDGGVLSRAGFEARVVSGPRPRGPAAPPGAGGFFRKIAGTTAMTIINRIAQMVRRSMNQITGSGDRVEAARMKRMTADQPASGQPGALHRTVTGDRLQCVLGAGRSEAAAWRQHRGDSQLIASDQTRQHAAWQQQDHRGSPCERRCAPAEQLGAEGIEGRAVCPRPGLDDQVPRRLPRLDFDSPDFAQPASKTIAGHRGRLMLGDDQPHPWLARLVVRPEYVHVLEAAAAALGETAANVRRAREPMRSRQARR
jgi:hypothetical protein